MSRARPSLGTSGRMRRAASALAALALGLLLGLGWPSAASAHAVLVSSSPADGARLAAAPAEVRLEFDENVQVAADGGTVVRDDGLSVGAGAVRADGREVVVPLRAEVPRGAYTASWRVVSADGHVVAGALRFGVGIDPGVPAAASAAPTDPLSVVAAAAQGIAYFGLAGALGVPLALLLFWPGVADGRRVRGLVLGGWSLLVLGTVARLAVLGPLATGSGAAGVLRFDGLGTTLGTVTGLAGLARLLLAGLLLPWLLRPARLVAAPSGAAVDRAGGVAAPTPATVELGPRPDARGSARRLAPPAVLALGLLVATALDGHAAVGSDAAVAVAAAALHLAAMAAWLGGLAVLLVAVLPALRGSAAELPALRRWSVLAFVTVAVLVLSGEYQAWRQLDPVDSLVGTPYGLTLLIKVAVTVGALLLALLARGLVLRLPLPSRRRIRIAVLAEIVLVIAALVTATVLVTLPPARTTYGPPVAATLRLGDERAILAIDTSRAGVERMTVRLVDGAGREVASTGVAGTLGSAELPAVPVRFARHDGRWLAAVVVPSSGAWTLTLTVQQPDGSALVASTGYTVW